MQVTVSQLQNGTTADANQVNANLNAIVNAINGGLDATNVSAGSMDDTRLAPSISPITRAREMFSPFVYSGLTMATSASLTTTLLAGTYYVNGKRITIANTPVTVAASKDTYIDLKDDGTVVPVPVANNATAGMTLTLNSDGSNALRVGCLISSGTAIVQSLQNAFNLSPVAPNTRNWFGFDPIGNAVYSMHPTNALLGYAHITSVQGGITTQVDLAGLSIPTIVPTTGRVKITGYLPQVLSSVSTDRFDYGIRENTTQLNGGFQTTGSQGSGILWHAMVTTTPGLHTYKLSLARGIGSGTLQVYSDATLAQAFIMAERA